MNYSRNFIYFSRNCKNLMKCTCARKINESFETFWNSSNYSEWTESFSIKTLKMNYKFKNKIQWRRFILIHRNSETSSDPSLTSGKGWVLTVSALITLVVLVDIFLPSYSRCPISFMKKILSGEKRYALEEIY